jgi:hypothetical protein
MMAVVFVSDGGVEVGVGMVLLESLGLCPSLTAESL